MLMHAYQVQRIFHLYGLPILRGGVAYTPSEAVAVSKNLRTRSACLKAQIYSSGRSKGIFKDSKLSGVVFAHTPKKIEEKARSMLGHYLVTKSTGENGTEVKKIYVEERVNINRSYVISIKIDFDKEGFKWKNLCIKIDRQTGTVKECEPHLIFTNICAKEYNRLIPFADLNYSKNLFNKYKFLGKTNLTCTKRKFFKAKLERFQKGERAWVYKMILLRPFKAYKKVDKNLVEYIKNS